ncbi:MAG: 4'-phosphopantetheinyl transferase superfamily protein [Flavobacterium sp.]|nr:4'-phosphopantetheinyl transferase superfamily protein [Flavobacterium sp.]
MNLLNKIYLKYNLNQVEVALIANEIASLPESFQEKIGNYTSLIKKQQRLNGLKLLQDAIFDLKLDTAVYNLNNIQYTPKGKPYFTRERDFSVAYTDGCTVLVFSDKGSIGVDIEKVKSIDLIHYKNYFTTREWEIINTAPTIELEFYKLWTRKEALVKAMGVGFFMELNTLDVLDDAVVLDKKWAIQTELINQDYVISIVQEVVQF